MLSVLGLVWYTYFTPETLERARSAAQEQRDRQRKALATAVLGEMWSVLARLRVLRSQGPGQFSADLLSHPMTTLAASAPAVFEAATVHGLALVVRRIHDVQVLLERLPDFVARSKDQNIDEAARQTAEDHRVETAQGIRIRAAWAHNSAVELVQLLRSEGGVNPSGPDAPPVSMFDLPKLLPDPFGRAD